VHQFELIQAPQRRYSPPAGRAKAHTKQVNIRCTPEQHARGFRAAEKTKRKLSDWARMKIDECEAADSRALTPTFRTSKSHAPQHWAVAASSASKSRPSGSSAWLARRILGRADSPAGQAIAIRHG
jgi:hypothetical protein